MTNPKCPNCGSLDTRKYYYGYPPSNYDTDIYVLGGDVLFESNPLYHCNNCETDFGLMVGKVEGSEVLSQHTLENFTFTEYIPTREFTRLIIEEKRGEILVKVHGTLEDDGDSEAEKEYIITEELWEDFKERLFNEVYILSWPIEELKHVPEEPDMWAVHLNFKNGKKVEMVGRDNFPPYFEEFKKVIDQFFIYD